MANADRVAAALFLSETGIAIKKLDALTELVEAIGAAVVGDTYTTPHRHLAEILARRWGQCTKCFGAGCDGPSASVLDRRPCKACNGTGKAQGGPDG